MCADVLFSLKRITKHLKNNIFNGKMSLFLYFKCIKLNKIVAFTIKCTKLCLALIL